MTYRKLEHSKRVFNLFNAPIKHQNYISPYLETQIIYQQFNIKIKP